MNNIFEELEDSQRIKANTKKYKDFSISDAFADYYGLNVSYTETVEAAAIALNLNDVVTARLVAINNKEAIFEAVNIKERMTSKVSLNKYPSLIKRVGDEFQVKIIAKSSKKSECQVDMFAPIFERWIDEIILNQTEIPVVNLELMMGRYGSGGYNGKINVEPLSELAGVPVYVDAFIPGSQIVLNIEHDFNKWVGKTVTALIDKVSTKPNRQEISVICSVKKYLNSLGDQSKVAWYNAMVNNNQEWKQLLKTTFEGIVTGVINSSKKTGVFVEIPQYSITVLIPTDAKLLTSYHPEQNVAVKLVSVDATTYYDSATEQTKHNIPYEVENGHVKNVNIETVFEFA